MENYKILVIVLLTISITMTTSISYAQISEQIPCPKKQIDNGVEPHDSVVCRDDLINKYTTSYLMKNCMRQSKI